MNQQRKHTQVYNINFEHMSTRTKLLLDATQHFLSSVYAFTASEQIEQKLQEFRNMIAGYFKRLNMSWSVSNISMS